jgi:hypothetical protein
VDTVEIVDPTHPLYGKALPLVGITTKKRLGRVAIVWIDPGIEKLVPLGATSLADAPATSPSPCRLSVASVESLLAVVASLPNTGSEEHGESHPSAATSEATGATRAASRGERAAARRSEGHPSSPGMDDPQTAKPGFGEGEMGHGDEAGGL